MPDQHAVPDIDPVNVIWNAARQSLISTDAAETIIATRIHGQPVRDLSRSACCTASQVLRTRQLIRLQRSRHRPAVLCT